MARSRSVGAPKGRNDAYTMMLFITFVATVAGCILLYLDHEEYGNTPVPAPQSLTPPALTQPGGGAAQAPVAPTNDTRNAQVSPAMAAPVAPVAPVAPADTVSVSRRVTEARPVSRVVNTGGLLPLAIPTSATVPVGTTVVPPEPPAAKPVTPPVLDIPAVVVPPIK